MGIAIGVAVAMALLVLAVVFAQSRGPKPWAHARTVAAIGTVENLASTLERQVLESRSGLVTHYDGLVATAKKMGSALEGLHRTLAESDAKTPAVMEAAMDVDDVSAQTQRNLERFKQESAVLKNSLRYLPMAGENLVADIRAAGGPDVDAVVRQVHELVRTTLVHNLLHEPALLMRHNQALAKFNVLIPTMHKRVRHDAGLLGLHAKRAAGHHDIVRPVVAALLDGALAAKIAVLRQAYGQHFASSNATAARWLWVLYALSVILLLGLLLAVRHLRRTFRTLEHQVAIRTAALSHKNQTMAIILDNVEQGLVLLNREGAIVSEPSAAMKLWFSARTGQRWGDILRCISPDTAEFFALAWDMLDEGFMPLDVCLSQLPQDLTHNGRELAMTYQAVTAPSQDEDRSPTSGEFDQILVMVTDVSEANARARAEARQRELLALFTHMTEDVALFREFEGETETLMGLLQGGLPENEERRHLHTLKGNFAVFGLEALSNWIHNLETLLSEERRQATSEELGTLARQWHELLGDIAPILQHETSVLPVQHSDIQALIDGLRQGRPSDELLVLVQRWTLEPASRRLRHLANQAQRIAATLDLSVKVGIDDGGLRLPPGLCGAVWQAMIHLLRNALDHGIESAETRVAEGKPPLGQLNLLAYQEGADVVLAVMDDGRGIDWKAIAEQGHTTVDEASPQALLEMLLADGVTTRRTVTTMSGRGVGMAALRAAVAAADGTIEVDSVLGEGTTVRLRFEGFAHHPMMSGVLCRSELALLPVQNVLAGTHDIH